MNFDKVHVSSKTVRRRRANEPATKKFNAGAIFRLIHFDGQVSNQSKKNRDRHLKDFSDRFFTYLAVMGSFTLISMSGRPRRTTVLDTGVRRAILGSNE